MPSGTMPSFARRHPVATYFALTFAISWGGVLAVIALSGIPRSDEGFGARLPIAIAVMLVGPSVAGLTMTALVHGREGISALWARARTWRVAPRWYAIALLTAPVVMTVQHLALSLASPAFVPGIMTADDRMSRLLFGLAAGVTVGILEEIGWTGFATLILRRRYTILATGLVIGVPWGAWHVIGQVVFASGTYAGDLPLAAFLAMRTVGLLIGTLPAYRVLMVWVHDRTRSLFVVMVMHMSLTAATMIFEPVGISGASLIVLDVVSIVVWWGVVAVFAAVSDIGRASSRASAPTDG